MRSELTRLGCEAERVLRESAKFMRWRDLAHAALDRLSPPYAIANDPAEDLREKVAMARRFGLFYVPSPWNVIGKTDWFVAHGDGSLRFWNNIDSELFEMPGSASAGYKAAEKVSRLSRKLLTKVFAGPELDKGRGRGFVVEEHMREWFSKKWPEFFEDNSHDGPSPADWWLNVNGRKWSVDAASVVCGVVKLPQRGKMFADIHVFGEIKSEKWVPQGYLFGKEMPKQNFDVSKARPIAQLIVWLNCYQEGIPYKLMEKYALYGKPAKRVGDILERK